MSIWRTSGGVIIRDGTSGDIERCAECPCEPSPPSCMDTDTFGCYDPELSGSENIGATVVVTGSEGGTWDGTWDLPGVSNNPPCYFQWSDAVGSTGVTAQLAPSGSDLVGAVFLSNVLGTRFQGFYTLGAYSYDPCPGITWEVDLIRVASPNDQQGTAEVTLYQI